MATKKQDKQAEDEKKDSTTEKAKDELWSETLELKK